MVESYSRTLVYAAATMLWIPKPAGVLTINTYSGSENSRHSGDACTH